MRHWHVITIHWLRRTTPALARTMSEVDHELMTEKVKVNPGRGATPFRATQGLTVEMSRAGQFGHRDRQMKRTEFAHRSAA